MNERQIIALALLIAITFGAAFGLGAAVGHNATIDAKVQTCEQVRD